MARLRRRGHKLATITPEDAAEMVMMPHVDQPAWRLRELERGYPGMYETWVDLHERMVPLIDGGMRPCDAFRESLKARGAHAKGKT